MSHKRERLNDFLWEYDTYADMLADAQNISLGAICKTVAGALYVKTQKELTYLNAPGATGTTGDTGQTGDTGPPGTGMTWLGAWSSITTYLEGDGVENNGSTYIALGTNTNSEPPSINWDLVADKGATGSQGNPGADGATGPQGNPGPNSVSGTTASTLTGLLKGTGSLVAVASAPTDFVATGDARLSDARTPLTHSHPQSDITNLTTDLGNKQPLDGQLTDLAALTYAGNALKAVRVNAAATAFELVTASAEVAWGAITGTLASQTDLQTALDGKAASLGVDDNYVTDAEKTVIGNTSGTNTGDQSAIPNSALANMTQKTYKGRTTASTGAPEDVAVATLKTDLTLVKGDVGLGNVDNTTDAGKPVSDATVTALALKAPLASPTFTGTVTVPVGLTGVLRADSGVVSVDAGGGGTIYIKRAAAATISAGTYETWLVLAANSGNITGTGFVTVMEITGVGVGSYHFKCELIYQTTATTTGINVTATHTGTTTTWIMRASIPTTGGAAATKAATSVAATSAAGLWETEVSLVKGSAIGTLSNFAISVNAQNTDQIVVIEGSFIVTVTGSFQIQLSAESASLVCTARAGSFLTLRQLN